VQTDFPKSVRTTNINGIT